MIASLSVLSGPVNQLVPLDFLKDHLRINQSYDLKNLVFYLQTAIEVVQNYTNRSLLTQQLQFSLGQSPRFGLVNMSLPSSYGFSWYNQRAPAIKLPRPPVVSVDQVSLGVWGVTDTILTQGVDYDIDIESQPARILFYSYFDLNILQCNLLINYTSGYGLVGNTVPNQLVQAVLLITTALYQHRGESDDDIITRGARSLMDPFCEETFGSFHA